MTEEITRLDDERVVAFARLTERQLRSAGLPLVIVESPKVIASALDCGLNPVSLLTERRHIEGDAAEMIARCPASMPVYTGERALLEQLTGYTLTRGVLCAMERPAELSAREAVRGARRVAVLDDVCDSTNVGAIFRSAAALGIDAVLLGPTSCDPLTRRVIRVSMGAVFRIPWARIGADTVGSLKALGFKGVALALRHDNIDIDSPRLASEPRLALILGAEGNGLPAATIDAADYVARIPMARNVDSLNVAAAAAVAFWQLRVKNSAENS